MLKALYPAAANHYSRSWSKSDLHARDIALLVERVCESAIRGGHRLVCKAPALNVGSLCNYRITRAADAGLSNSACLPVVREDHYGHITPSKNADLIRRGIPGWEPAASVAAPDSMRQPMARLTCNV